MLQTKEAVTASALKQAIEHRDGMTLTSFYADNATVKLIDRNNPPSKPREIHGRIAIGEFWDELCSRAMTHKVSSIVSDGNKLAFTEDCAYPDGTKVFCEAMVELKNGKIARETVVQAWDE